MAILWGVALGQDIDLQRLRTEGQALFEEKRTLAAAEAFARVVESADATAADWLNLALARYEVGADAAADVAILDALDRAAALEPGNPAAHYLRGLTHSRRGRDAEAAAEFGAAAALDDTDAATLYNWASSLHNLGRVDEALPLYERVAGMGFDVAQQFFVSSLYRTGRALAVSDGIDAARPYIERYQEHQRRLSQAQRAPTALEAGRYKRVAVPRVNLVSATPATAAGIEFQEGAALGIPTARAGGAPALADFGAGLRIVHRGVTATDAAGDVGLGVSEGVLAVGDHDRDGTAEVLVLGPTASVLLRSRDAAEGPAFEGVAVEGLPVVASASEAAWVDADHDGDLDIIVATAEDGAGLRWVVNHGGGSFVEATAAAGLGGSPARRLAWADFDDDSDVDLYALRSNGTGTLYSNARGGRFEDIGDAVGAQGPGDVLAVVAEDMDNDGWFDLVLAGASGVSMLVNNGDGTFHTVEVDAEPTEALFAADLNNDGWLDLVTGRGAVLVNAGDGFVSSLVSGIARPGERVVGVGDVQGDGAIDLLVSADDELRWRTQTAPVGNWARLALAGVKSNTRGVGTLVEFKAGGLYQRRLQRGRWSHFGLGTAAVADVIRITWPNGIIQNQTTVEANAAIGPIGEVERLEGSCPLLYTWDGTGWRFINEVLGVAPLGMPLATGVIHPADYDEYVPIPGEALRARDGFFELRLTEELREAGFLDTVRLLAIDHPAEVAAFPDERFAPPPHPQFGIYGVAAPRPVTARDQTGRDWTAELAAVDGNRARPFAPYLYEGLATAHHLEIDLPDAHPDETPRLFLTGWVYWATGSINLQVDQDPRVVFAPVSLEVPDGAGGWRVAIEDIGLPNAKNSTLIVELADVLVAGDPRVRLTTTMRLYWDGAFYTVGDGGSLYRPVGEWQGAWGTPLQGALVMRNVADPVNAGPAPLRVHVLEPAQAEIQWRGFSTLVRDDDGFETFDYATVSNATNWNQHRGSYTRYGAVDELLDTADDRLVIIGTGDEVSVRFAADLPPLAEGWQRNWLLYLNGWVKDGDPNTLGGERVEPLPTHAMTHYPGALAVPQDWDATAAPDAWRARYNTRPARIVNAPLRPSR
jgi:hypothetical protein